MKEKTQQVQFKKILGYYWVQMREYKMAFFLLMLFYTIGIALAEGIMPLIAKNIIDTMSAFGGNEDSFDDIWKIFLYFVLVIVGYNIFFRSGDYLIVAFEAKVLRRLTHMVLDKLLVHSPAFFADNFSGSLIAQSKRFLGNFSNLLEAFVFNLWWTMWKSPIVIVVLFFVNATIAATLLGWTVLYLAVVYLFVHYGKKHDALEASADSSVTAHFSDIITNILTVKMFATAPHEKDQFAHTTKDQYTKQITAWNFEITQIMVQGVLFAVLEIGGMYIAITLWIAGSISIGTVVLLQIYTAKLFGSLWPLGRSIKRFIKMIVEAKEIVDVFEKPVGVKNARKPEQPRIDKGSITFRNVGFYYENNDKVFDDFNLTIAAGEKIGLVGHSGAGKTTIAKLLLRFADVSAGVIMIDGQDISRIAQDDLRSTIAYVPQDPLLFHRTLRDNIAYGKIDATDEEIIAAAKKAHAHDFITALPHGYDTLVGERGIKLSGGERQRVAIARAMLKDAPILILDEATSALDSVSESYIQEAFTELMKNRTTIVIAHRLSTVQKMDRIIVLEDGTIVEEGTHATLIQKDNGVYNMFWQSQAGQFLTE